MADARRGSASRNSAEETRLLATGWESAPFMTRGPEAAWAGGVTLLEKGMGSRCYSGGGESNPGPLEEQSVLLTTAPSLQPPAEFLTQ